MSGEFRFRTEECDQCFEGRYEIAGGPGYVSLPCDNCNGSGEVDSACFECLTVTALNDDGECERCHDGHALSVAEFNAKHKAHEALLDLTVKQLTGDRWGVAA